ncbi:MAG: class I SAM-dependent methyltransferase [Cyanobacteriota bacterium]|nr:class I SAM-dependent methyltransferase [Cyanobacteriota bacterium]
MSQALAPVSGIATSATPPPNWVHSRHPLGWIIDRLLAVPPLRQPIDESMAPSLSWPVHRVLDLGCSVGVGTEALKIWLESRQEDIVRVQGLDLSPQMLAAAGFDSVQRVPCHPRHRVLVAIRAIKPSR